MAVANSESSAKHRRRSAMKLAAQDKTGKLRSTTRVARQQADDRCSSSLNSGEELLKEYLDTIYSGPNLDLKQAYEEHRAKLWRANSFSANGR